MCHSLNSKELESLNFSLPSFVYKLLMYLGLYHDNSINELT